MIFEWDEEKNRRNLTKHGISFTTASHVFRDSERLEIYDCYHSGSEDRYIVIGRAHKILFAVFTDRKN